MRVTFYSILHLITATVSLIDIQGGPKVWHNLYTL